MVPTIPRLILEELYHQAMAAGFTGIRFECLVYNYKIMEFFK
ncbi:hypothetical protein CK203_094947 [Vitis vinifera]|uniref:Uncharacterized protein n=1 Tax=Vitis vinifera TaxID=29760 RepID=A0A438DQK3_VITVI|nr:hypothetical protein CK203_094947 [Vitis vinifera]